MKQERVWKLASPAISLSLALVFVMAVLGCNWGSGSSSSDIHTSDATKLKAGEWVDGLLTDSIREVWYSFDVTAGTTYFVMWDDTDNNDDTGAEKTMDIQVAVYYSDETEIFDLNEPNDESFTAISSGTVKVKVYPYPYDSSDTGTYSIAYNIIMR